MNLKSFRPAALGASLLILAAAGAAVAQTAPPPPGMMGGVHDMAGPDGHPDHAAMMQRHIQHLRDVLQLSPAQEPALQAFIAAMKPPEGRMDKMREEHEEMAKLTTPQRLDQMKSRMAEHEAMMDQHIAAVKRFYAQLSPTQQKAFDALPPMMMRHGGPRGGMEGRMGGHHMGGHGMDGGHEG
ncbi:Spy/CpxP family protein refolding chaperone [Phenylobacterium aquaticum]|uniref:Spy/CpxP family protein refolding chaperone n=1 Tax=Phenylobacterium aquaticum TaxID=1763816 RepID=UPI0026F144FB|nr:Spy/CpxP family protein refolding chaperone [Phenylobacterium aquaticum]